jgi:hypothetical protein
MSTHILLPYVHVRAQLIAAWPNPAIECRSDMLSLAFTKSALCPGVHVSVLVHARQIRRCSYTHAFSRALVCIPVCI